MIILVSLAVCIVGALVYALSVNPKLNMMGLVAFGCGLLAFLLQLSPKMISLLGGQESIIGEPKEKKTLVVVDDNKDDRDLVTRLLVKIGFSVMAFSDGQTALDWLAAQPQLPYATLVDLRMNGGMDGFVFAEKFRNLTGGKFVAMGAYTGYVDEPVRTRAMQADFDFCINKPVSADKLEMQLRMFVRP